MFLYLQNYILAWLGSNDIEAYSFAMVLILAAAILVTWKFPVRGLKPMRLAPFIEGQWLRKGHDFEGTTWQIMYVFKNGVFSIQAHPEFKQTGQYKILHEVENAVMVEVSSLDGDGNLNPQILELGIDKKNDHLVINGRSYKRMT